MAPERTLSRSVASCYGFAAGFFWPFSRVASRTSRASSFARAAQDRRLNIELLPPHRVEARQPERVLPRLH
jgi:hypothetical protein